MKSVTLSAQPALRRLLIAGALVMSFAAGAVASTRLRAHDPRLDGAVDHLTQAQALLDASSSGELSKNNQKIFNKQMGRANQAINDAIAAIGGAIEAAEGGQ
ncbi:MAG TPA: hypothetical protein VMZ90_05235 [Vicinamibacterales bacterium]|nr:hypothetical protein [Vicinamibacterales bacterium]